MVLYAVRLLKSEDPWKLFPLKQKRTENGKWAWISWAHCSYWVIQILQPRCLPKLRSFHSSMLSPLPAFIHVFPTLHLHKFPDRPSHVFPQPQVHLYILLSTSTFYHFPCCFMNLSEPLNHYITLLLQAEKCNCSVGMELPLFDFPLGWSSVDIFACLLTVCCLFIYLFFFNFEKKCIALSQSLSLHLAFNGLLGPLCITNQSVLPCYQIK